MTLEVFWVKLHRVYGHTFLPTELLKMVEVTMKLISGLLLFLEQFISFPRLIDNLDEVIPVSTEETTHSEFSRFYNLSLVELLADFFLCLVDTSTHLL